MAALGSGKMILWGRMRAVSDDRRLLTPSPPVAGEKERDGNDANQLRSSTATPIMESLEWEWGSDVGAGGRGGVLFPS
ncbi:hypothetical protein GN956_G12245 [Arapaima gigas]